MDFGNIDFAKLQALLAERGLELVLRPVATSTSSVLKDVTNRAPTKSAAQPAVQVATQQASSVTKAAAKPTPNLATISATEPSSSTKPTPSVNIATNPSTKATTRPQRPPVSYSPYQHSFQPLLPAPAQNSKSKPARPLIKLRYMKKPRGTPGRKGKGGWPEPMRYIWGTTVAEYRFMFSIAKCLVYKKLDTTKGLRDQDEDLVDWVIDKFYQLIPEFVEVYGGSKWPARAFIQIALKSAVEARKRLAKGIGSSLYVSAPSLATPGEDDDMDEDDILVAANIIVDGDYSEDESTMASVSSVPLANGNRKQRAEKISESGFRLNEANEDSSDSGLGEPVASEFNSPRLTCGIVFDYEDEE